MVNCERCGEWTDYYHILPSGAEVCFDCHKEYEEGLIDYITDYRIIEE